MKIAAATRSVRDYLLLKLEESARIPRDDFITFIANARLEHRPLSRNEQLGMAFNFYTVGLDTVSTNIGLHFRHLAENAQHQARLRAHPEQIALATEELLRAYAAVTTFRICTRELVINGARVMPGDRLALSTTLACRDDRKYENPHEVRFDRGPQHETFAFGPHRCVGMHWPAASCIARWRKYFRRFRNSTSSRAPRSSRHWARLSSLSPCRWCGMRNEVRPGCASSAVLQRWPIGYAGGDCADMRLAGKGFDRVRWIAAPRPLLRGMDA